MILKLISAGKIRSQSELAARLRQKGYDVTQASISRDLDELSIVKSAGFYVVPRKHNGTGSFGILALEPAGDALIVARCEPGLASAAAVRIDTERFPEIVGTIAGDDTIFIAIREKKDQRRAMRKVWEIFDG